MKEPAQAAHGSSDSTPITCGPAPGMLNLTPVAAPQFAFTVLIASRSESTPESALFFTKTGPTTPSVADVVALLVVAGVDDEKLPGGMVIVYDPKADDVTRT